MQELKNRVEKAEIRVHQKEPHKARGNCRKNTGQVKQRPEEGSAFDIPVQKKRNHKCKNQICRNCHNRIQNGGFHGDPEGLLVTAQQFYIVFQAYPGGFAYDVVIAKAVVAAQQHRKQVKDQKSQYRRQSKAPAHKIHSCFCLHRFHFAHPFSPLLKRELPFLSGSSLLHISMIIYHRSPEPGHLHLPRSN